MSIVIIDYGMGNVGSIRNMLRKCGVTAQISGDPGEIERATKLILPGVGAFDQGMHRLRQYGLVTLLDRKVREEKTPLLGICLGMHLLARSSEEGREAGLGWFDAEVVRFRFGEQPGVGLKVPHMGWNTVRPQASDGVTGLVSGARFYFVHSYYVVCHNNDDVIARTTYGFSFASAMRRDNVIGVQFHPEKSHRFGMAFLSEFARSSSAVTAAEC
ncbi:MAG TPA: imidazole glycerol phosphate synthase subunit HisH [Thermoanaerobaculia bacterium]|nr:imidazole glycerol phosphate synthase subunit HisH [Thermoanaerobaculia bacterium]